jgi:hypothetical protein
MLLNTNQRRKEYLEKRTKVLLERDSLLSKRKILQRQIRSVQTELDNMDKILKYYKMDKNNVIKGLSDG